jgi:hypothetical protein
MTACHVPQFTNQEKHFNASFTSAKYAELTSFGGQIHHQEELSAVMPGRSVFLWE